MDNVQVGTLISSVDAAHAARFAEEGDVLGFKPYGETTEEIAARLGIHLNKADAVVRCCLHFGFLRERDEGLFVTEQGQSLALRGSAAGFPATFLALAKDIQRAVQCRLFDGPDTGETLEALAARTGTSTEDLFLMVQAAKRLLVMKQDGELVRPTEVGKAFLTDASPFSMTGLINILPLDYKMFEEAIQSSDPPIFEPEMAPFLVRAMHQKSAWTARMIAELLDLSQARRVVDVGAASGILAIELCRANKQLEGIAFDLDWVTPFTAQTISQYDELYGLGGRVTAESGNMFKSLPEADAFVLLDIFHDWSIEDVLSILENIYNALPKGGRLTIGEGLFDGDRMNPFNIVGFNMAVVKMFQNGGQRTASHFREILTAQGFGKITMKPTVSGVTVIECAKL